MWLENRKNGAGLWGLSRGRRRERGTPREIGRNPNPNPSPGTTISEPATGARRDPRLAIPESTADDLVSSWVRAHKFTCADSSLPGSLLPRNREKAKGRAGNLNREIVKLN